MKKKMKISELKIKSFSTSIQVVHDTNTIRGGHTGSGCDSMDNACELPTDYNCSCNGGCVIQ